MICDVFLVRCGVISIHYKLCDVVSLYRVKNVIAHLE